MTAAPLDLVDRKAALAESLRKLRRGLEMSASIMRDPERTGGWDGSERVANSYDRFRIQVEKIEAEIAALPSYPAPAGDAWLPIETAPKDGTWVLVFRPAEDVAHRYSSAVFSGGTWGGRGWRYPYGDQPTHWMPLPAPPTATGEK